ncbi:hypothetical protein D5041_15255 [Verminephrobacter aporrectodeae subsp. tuberculatae]|nr:hypothetical protein [Verminephrobacter aporrectodeae subsp. tuberculatae]MCW5290351.1 hypothetical protein [Verminephrobacter aporrectodeae subsp. tuberculatae]
MDDSDLVRNWLTQERVALQAAVDLDQPILETRKSRSTEYLQDVLARLGSFKISSIAQKVSHELQTEPVEAK